jgi:hypothetical protein
MMLSQVLLRFSYGTLELKLSQKEKSNPYTPMRRVLKLFLDDLHCPFSIHTFGNTNNFAINIQISKTNKPINKQNSKNKF